MDTTRTIHSHALAVLGFSDLLNLVAGRTQTAPGRRLIETRSPQTDIDGILTARDCAPALLQLLLDGNQLPGLSAEDISDILRRSAADGAVLPGEDLVLCRSLLDTVAEAKEFLLGAPCAPHPELLAIGNALTVLPELRSALHRCLDDDGELLDRASRTLAELRRKMASLESRLQKRLEQMLKRPDVEELVQDQFVTSRNGRFVIPVQRSEKSAIGGIIHDHSNSGQTVFLEPAETVEMGNELSATRLQERDEVVRILAELSHQVHLARHQLGADLDLVARLDANAAIARWAQIDDCVFPRFGPDTDIRQARHPLLIEQFRRERRLNELVPLNLSLSRKTKAVSITGSNTGGKTVTLKTIGLLSAAAQAGLPIPAAPETELEIFDGLFADIGDEQSIETSLSTFSAHMTHVNRILKSVGAGRSLVLLDELGAGTDPLEGGALACAILEALAATDCLTITTTHLGMVKTFVHERPGMVNAAVRFNTDTLKPDYVLELGRPGASHALAIARRLGLPETLLNQAECMLSTDHMRLESMLAQMEDDQRQISTREQEMASVSEELRRDRDALRDELTSLRKERRRLLHEAYAQAEAIVENTRREMERQLLRIRESRAADASPQQEQKRVRQALQEKGRRLSRGRKQTAAKPEQPLLPHQLRPGDSVWVETLNDVGTLVQVPAGHGKAVVELRGLRFTVRENQLGAPPVTAVETPKPTVKVSRPKPQGRTPSEVNLIGLRVDEAVDRLDAFLSQALLANLEMVRIVHGFGTGRLRRGLHDWLKAQRIVKKYRLGKHGEDPGGEGATIVTLQE